MSQKERTPNFTPILSSKMNQEPLKEKPLNTTQTGPQLKTPISYTSKYNARKPIANNKNTKTAPTAKPTEENLTQSAKTRQFISKLQAANSSVYQSIINGNASQTTSSSTHSAHIASHQNLNTPKNNASNSNNGSAKQASKENSNSASKKPVLNSAKTSIAATAALNSYANNSAKSATKPSLPTVIMNSSTPSNRNFPKVNMIKKPEETLNPVINGIDYSHIIAMKPQLGYSGPGYIVEYNCDAKYLRGLTIQKGFWKVVASEMQSRDPALAYLGPAISLKRIDVADSLAKTPSKNPFSKFDFDFKPRYNTVAKSHDIANSLSSTSCLNLETKTKIKKTLRWADGLEPINESGNSVCSPATCGNMSSNGTPHTNLSASADDGTKRKSLRKSFSLGDINDFILLHESEEEANNQANHTADDKYDLNKLPIKFMSLNDDNSMNCGDLSLTHQHGNEPNATLDLEKHTYLIESIQTNAKSSPGSQAQTPSFSFDCSYQHPIVIPQLNPMLIESSADQYVTPKHNNLLMPQPSMSNEKIAKSLSIEDMSLTEASKVNSTEIDSTQHSAPTAKCSIVEQSAILSQSASTQQVKNETIIIETPKMLPIINEFEMAEMESEYHMLKNFVDSLLNRNQELGKILNDLNKLKNKRTGKPILKLKVNSSGEFLRWFNLLDTVETYVKLCKENLSQK